MTPTIPNHQQTAPIGADAADGDASSRVVRRRYSLRVRLTSDAENGTGEACPPPRRLAGSTHAELARWIRVYGGDSLDVRRDNAQFAVNASAGMIVAIAGLAPLVAGWGYASLAWFGAAAMVVLLAVFFEAVTRRNRNQKRIDDVEAICARAVEAALAEGERPEMAVAA